MQMLGNELGAEGVNRHQQLLLCHVLSIVGSSHTAVEEGQQLRSEDLPVLAHNLLCVGVGLEHWNLAHSVCRRSLNVSCTAWLGS